MPLNKMSQAKPTSWLNKRKSLFIELMSSAKALEFFFLDRSFPFIRFSAFGGKASAFLEFSSSQKKTPRGQSLETRSDQRESKRVRGDVG